MSAGRLIKQTRKRWASLRILPSSLENTYHLVVAHDGHNTERLHSLALRIEGWASTLISEDNIRMNVCIEVGNAIGLHGVLEGSFSLTTGVICAATARVIGAIAVNVHVIVVAIASL